VSDIGLAELVLNCKSRRAAALGYASRVAFFRKKLLPVISEKEQPRFKRERWHRKEAGTLISKSRPIKKKGRTGEYEA